MSALKKPDLFSDGASVRVLTFDVELDSSKKITLALNIQKIKEIIRVKEYNVQPLTGNYYPLVGLVNLRHLSIPVLDLNHFFSPGKHSENPIRDERHIIICEFQRLHLGILVNGIHKIRQFKNAHITRVPEALESFQGNIFNGMIEHEGNFIKLLDIEYILTKLNVDVAPAPHTPSGLELKGKKILLVEDSKLFQKKLLNLFRDKGADVILAEDGVEGLEKLKLHAHELDLIFTDIEMPRLNGIGMVRKLRQNEEWKKIPVIFNTSISNAGLIEDINSEGLGTYIVKFDEQEISRVFKDVFNT